MLYHAYPTVCVSTGLCINLCNLRNIITKLLFMERNRTELDQTGLGEVHFLSSFYSVSAVLKCPNFPRGLT